MTLDFERLDYTSLEKEKMPVTNIFSFSCRIHSTALNAFESYAKGGGGYVNCYPEF